MPTHLSIISELGVRIDAYVATLTDTLRDALAAADVVPGTLRMLPPRRGGVVRQEPLSIWDEDLKGLDLDAFPRAQDLVVEATYVEVGEGADRQSWTNLRYVVPSWDVDVVFPWWDRSMEQMSEWTVADVPHGSIDSPYADRDEGWSLLIWQTGDDVFVMEGDGSEDHDDPPIYQRWFVVPHDLYRCAWEAAIEGFRGS